MLETPAYVHIVAGLEKLGVKAVDRLERLPAERHIAAWDVLGDLVAYQDVGRLPRGGRDARRQPAIFGRQVWPPHRRRAASNQLMDQVDQPVRIGNTVRIGVRNQRTRAGLEPGVSRDT